MIPISFHPGVNIPDLAGLHDHLLDVASEIVATGGDVATPVVFVLSMDGQLGMLSAATSSKDGIAEFQRVAVQNRATRACAVVMEVWTSENIQHRQKPSLDPEGGEAIVASIMTAGRQAMSVSRIERPANVVHKAPLQWLDESEAEYRGRFVR